MPGGGVHNFYTNKPINKTIRGWSRLPDVRPKEEQVRPGTDGLFKGGWIGSRSLTTWTRDGQIPLPPQPPHSKTGKSFPSKRGGLWGRGTPMNYTLEWRDSGGLRYPRPDVGTHHDSGLPSRSEVHSRPYHQFSWSVSLVGLDPNFDYVGKRLTYSLK